MQFVHSIYALFNGAIACSLLGPLVIRVQFWQRWRGLIWGLLFVSLPFIVWDWYAAKAGHWFFSADYTFSFRIVGLPLEEIAFFVTVPLACMFVWSVIERFDDKRLFTPRTAKWGSYATVLIFGALAVVQTHAYTRLVLAAGALAAIILSRWSELLASRRFWVFQGISLGLFMVFNTVLTSLPIIMYGTDAIVGFRIGTIPVEDFLYNFVLLDLFLLCFCAPSHTKMGYHIRHAAKN